MGMAASQARFLGLTARKTNTEFEGQQVNQQRTALANQSSGLFNQMLTLKVPTPPDSNAYYKTSYTYTDIEGACKIMSYTPVAGETNKYDLIIQKTVQENSFVNHNTVTDKVSKTTTDGKDAYYMGDKLLTGPAKITGYIDGSSTLAERNYFYYNVTSGSNTQTVYLKAEDITENIDKTVTLNQYNIQQSSRTKQLPVYGATMQLDANGRFSLISTGNNSYPMTYSKLEDEEAYNLAMREYTIDKDNYDKQISDINAQTETIQQQDRTLELRLKQLDTEQQAIQTELEAVTKVIDKNIESTFKTFA